MPHEPKRAASRWGAFFAVGVGTFMSALDSSVVNLVLPVVRDRFATDVATIEWVVTIYLLVVSGALLAFGRLGDLRGHRSVYLFGFGVFIAGSLLCAVAASEWALIGSRGLQAVGAAMLFANAPAIVIKSFPPDQRGRAMGLLATMTYLGLTAGPPLGGWLTARFGWPAVFYVNVPTGLLALSLGRRFVPRDAPGEPAEPFDLAGAGVFVLGLVALLLALNQGHARGWASPVILALFALGAAGLGLFLGLERRVRAPMLDLSLFADRGFSSASVSALLNYLCVSGAAFLLPFYLIQARHFPPDRAGVLLATQPIVMAVSAPLSGILSDRVGSRGPATLGMGVLALGCVLLARLGPGSPPGALLLALATVGLGTGTFISPNNSALMGAAPRHRQGIAAGILATARNLGMMLGIAAAGAVLTTVVARGGAGNEAAALFAGIRAGFLVAAGFAALGAVTSATR